MAKAKKKDKVEKVMGEFKRGKLKSGSGKKAKGRKQAMAIAMSEAKDSGMMMPGMNVRMNRYGKA